MQIAIVGTGYVGLVTGACLAEMGNQVTCVDADARKLAELERGQVPIHEPGLDQLVHENTKAGRLQFTDDLASAVQAAEVIFIAVGTPPSADGSADLGDMLKVAEGVGQAMTQPVVVVVKSTVPVGTADRVWQTIQDKLTRRGANLEFEVASNPEFLREGSAVHDFMYPDRIIIGTVADNGIGNPADNQADQSDTNSTTAGGGVVKTLFRWIKLIAKPWRSRTKLLTYQTDEQGLSKAPSQQDAPRQLNKRFLNKGQPSWGKLVMTELYSPFAKKQERLQFVGIRDAEMIKYAANAMLATRISFMNEVAYLCDEYGVDVEKVRLGIGSDSRIGPDFIYPGCGFGGSCFPKDLMAMIKMAEYAGLHDTIFEAVARRNEAQQQLLVKKVADWFGDDLTGKTYAIWGLAFKPETDDIRWAPAINIANTLCDLGARVKAWDPQAAEQAREVLVEQEVDFVDDPYLATEGADALLVVTEWRQIRQPDFERLASQLKSRVIFDGRNIYNPQRCADYGLDYIGIGRSSALLANRS